MLKQLKTFALPISMLVGGIFHGFFYRFSVVIPYFIFVMLLLTFSKLELKHLRFGRSQFYLLSIQVLGALAVYFALGFYDQTVAQGVFICVFAPTATAAAVITGMLGGNVGFIASFALLSNMLVAASAPVLFSLIGNNSSLDFMDSFLYICKEVLPMILIPLFLALAIQRWATKLQKFVLKIQSLSFYLWSFSLCIVTAKTVNFILSQPSSSYYIEIVMALLALVVCVGQFLIGRSIGAKVGDKVSAGQALGQKNTILAIWMAQIYLNPLASIAPASYVLWQNLINSYQIYRKR